MDLTDYGITSLTAAHADLVLLAAPTRLCRRSTDQLVRERENLDVLDCLGPGEQRQPARLSTWAIVFADCADSARPGPSPDG